MSDITDPSTESFDDAWMQRNDCLDCLKQKANDPRDPFHAEAKAALRYLRCLQFFMACRFLKRSEAGMPCGQRAVKDLKKILPKLPKGDCSDIGIVLTSGETKLLVSMTGATVTIIEGEDWDDRSP
ncbi:MAG: hypothetical protein ACF8QF_13945 [Phycisphaerales bacterium]